MFKKVSRMLLGSIAVAAILWLVTALLLIFWPEPRFTRPGAEVIGKNVLTRQPPDDVSMAVLFRMQDGVLLNSRWFSSDSRVIVLFLHGIMGSSQSCAETCRRIREMTGAQAVALDLRGHGKSGGIPGDIRYVGQYEDDVADVIMELQKRKPGCRIVLAGHSMGGGIALRYAASLKLPSADGYLLFAPHLGSKSPTARSALAGGEKASSEEVMKLDLPRTIGLVMLNTIRIPWLNARHTLFFNVPPQSLIHAYTYRAMVSMAPTDFVAALRADTKPLLVIVGSKDEAFNAEQFAPVIRMHENGKTVVVDGESHNSILRSSAAFEAVTLWLKHIQALSD